MLATLSGLYILKKIIKCITTTNRFDKSTMEKNKTFISSKLNSRHLLKLWISFILKYMHRPIKSIWFTSLLLESVKKYINVILKKKYWFKSKVEFYDFFSLLEVKLSQGKYSYSSLNFLLLEFLINVSSFSFFFNPKKVNKRQCCFH